MKYDFDVKIINKREALDMVKKYHYSNTLPKINKVFLGFYIEENLVGMLSLGYGTRPLHTIKAIFPSLNVENYLEIGRMCMTEEMPRNSESQMISKTVKWIKKNMKEVKILFTWADGFRGKVGYVYQACSFKYIGNIMTDAYMIDGMMVHPRKIKKLLVQDYSKEKRITVRPTLEQMKQFGIKHYKGKQFKYIRFMCDSKQEKQIMENSNVCFMQYPKEKDLIWKVKTDTGKWVDSEKPFYKTDDIEKEVQTTIFDFI